jgi:hypothetical protein
MRSVPCSTGMDPRKKQAMTGRKTTQRVILTAHKTLTHS